MEVRRWESQTNYLLHDFDVLRVIQPPQHVAGAPNEPLGQIYASEIPSNSSSFWLGYGSLEEKYMAKQEMRFSKLRE